ncbi:MAG TPA: glycosyltransferase family 2 protein [Anaerolineaceae bacterium]|nr:glycosyltransferase family 2 protein [Anaerolineaceae bacterium]
MANLNEQSQNSNSILALIPAFNEAERISGVITRTQSHLPVLVVDDGSTDATADIAAQRGAVVLRQIANQGKGAALLAGFKYALEHGYQAVVTLDADGQHDPEEIPLLINEYEKGGDLVIGERDFRKMPFPRNFSNTIGTWLFSWALGTYCPDNQSGYRLHSRRMIEASINSAEMNFEFEVEIITRCIELGFSIKWVPIKTIYAGEKSHIKPLRHIRHFFRLVRDTRRRMRDKKRDH